MNRTIKVFVFYAKSFTSIEAAKEAAKTQFEIKEIKNISRLDEYYKIIGCEFVDITKRQIGNKFYWFVCDESGRYADRVIYTVASKDGYLDIPGTVIIAGPEDMNGDLTSVTQQDIANIVSHMCLGEQDVDGERVVVPMIVY